MAEGFAYTFTGHIFKNPFVQLCECLRLFRLRARTRVEGEEALGGLCFDKLLGAHVGYCIFIYVCRRLLTLCKYDKGFVPLLSQGLVFFRGVVLF